MRAGNLEVVRRVHHGENAIAIACIVRGGPVAVAWSFPGGAGGRRVGCRPGPGRGSRRNAARGGSRSAAQRHLRIQSRRHDRPRRQLPFLQRALQPLRAARRGPGVRAGPQDPGRPHLASPRRRDQARSSGRGGVGQRDGRADGGAARNRQHELAHRHRQVVHPAGSGGGAHARDGGDRDLDAGLRARRERPLPLPGSAQPERVRRGRADDRRPDGRDVLELDRSGNRAVDGGHLRQRAGGVRREGRRRRQHDDEVRPRIAVQGQRHRQLRDVRHVPGRILDGRRDAGIRGVRLRERRWFQLLHRRTQPRQPAQRRQHPEGLRPARLGLTGIRPTHFGCRRCSAGRTATFPTATPRKTRARPIESRLTTRTTTSGGRTSCRPRPFST